LFVVAVLFVFAAAYGTRLGYIFSYVNTFYHVRILYLVVDFIRYSPIICIHTGF